jgi:hypothetical protein
MPPRTEGGEMNFKYTLGRLFGLGLVIAALSTGTAMAAGTTQQGLKADGLRLQMMAQAYQSHSAGSSAPQSVELRPGGLVGEKAYQHWATRATPPTARPDDRPGIRDLGSTASVSAPVTVSNTESGFDWSDAGVGAAGGLGFAGFAAAATVLARRLRRAKLAL